MKLSWFSSGLKRTHCSWLTVVCVCLLVMLGTRPVLGLESTIYGGILSRHAYGSDDGVFRMLVKGHGSSRHTRDFSWYGLMEEMLHKVVFHAFTPRSARVGCCRVGKGDGMCEHVGSRVYVRKGGDGLVRQESWCGLNYYIELYQLLKERGKKALHRTAEAPVRIPWCHVSLPVYPSDDTVLEIAPRGSTLGEWVTVMFDIGNKTVTEHGVQLEDVITDILSGANGPSEGICVVQEGQQLSVARCVFFLLGIILFAFSHRISASTACRMAGGSLTFISMSALFLAYIVWRQIPHRKSIVAMISLWSGAAIYFAKHLLVGSDNGEPALLPSLLKSPLCVAYVVVSGLVGMAVTYYFNDSSNEKINTILQVGLQIIGCVCMVMSPTSIEAGIVLTVGTCGAIYMHAAKSTKDSLKKHVPYELQIPEDIHVSSTPLKHRGDIGEGDNTPTVFRASTVAVPPSPKDFPDTSQLHTLVQRGKILNMDTDRTIAIGKGTYNALFLQGYEVDFEKGTITPPSTKAGRKKFR